MAYLAPRWQQRPSHTWPESRRWPSGGGRPQVCGLWCWLHTTQAQARAAAQGIAEPVLSSPVTSPPVEVREEVGPYAHLGAGRLSTPEGRTRVAL